MTNNRCVVCGEIIPEGRQVCPNCEAMIIKPTRGPKPKLTKAQRKEIEQRYLSEGISQYKLAKEYGVSQCTICLIVSPITREKQRKSCLRRYYRLKERRN